MSEGYVALVAHGDTSADRHVHEHTRTGCGIGVCYDPLYELWL
jgi:hypothetical protein